MIPDLLIFALLSIVIVLLQAYIRLTNKHKSLKFEHNYMSNHLLEIYKGLCSLKKTSKKAVPAPARATKTAKKVTKPKATK